VVAYGADHSSLKAPVWEAARSLGLELSPDPWPDEGFFVRGDSYSFVRQGIPSVWITGGLKAVDPTIDGRKKALEWFANVYHTPQDDMNQHFAMEAAVKAARVQFLAGNLIADADARPVWNRGDFFAGRFAHAK
jgi:Zn-dependent M28 family amino/carboxypeptidase